LAEKLERLWNVVNNQRRALCIFGDWSRYALGAPARDGWSEVIRVPTQNAQSPSGLITRRPAKDPKATVICGGSESIARFGFSGLDKTGFFAGQSPLKIAIGELPSFFHLNPPKAGESCQACRFL